MKKNILILITLVVSIFGFSFNVNAESDQTPSITICLKNVKDSDYKIDLLVKETDYKEYFNKESYYSYNDLKDSPIYQYNKDGYLAESLRNKHLIVNRFNKTCTQYTDYGIPNEFKVILELSDGTIKVSKKIIKTDYNYNISLNVKNMKYTNTDVFNWDFVIVVAGTLLIELILAYFFDIKNFKVILLANLLTLIGIQSLRFVNTSSYLVLFAIAELFAFGIEYLIYKKFFKNVSNKKIVIYTLVANSCSLAITFQNSNIDLITADFQKVVIIALYLLAFIIKLIVDFIKKTKKKTKKNR